MSYGKGMGKLLSNLDPLLEMLEAFDGGEFSKNIELIKEVKNIDVGELEKIIAASRKIKAAKSDIETVENGIDDIKNVLEIQNQVSYVSNIRDSIGLIAGSIDDIKRAADYANVFGAVVAMKPMLDEVLKLSVKMDLVLDLEEKMDSLLEVEARLDAKLEEMSGIEIRTNQSALLAVDMLNKITIKEKCIDEKLKEVKGYRDDMVDFNIATNYVPYTEDSVSKYDSRTNTLTLGIREGKPGAKGEPGEDGKVGEPGSAVHKGDKGLQGEQGSPGKDLHIDIMGTMQERKRYGNRAVGTTFLALDKRIPMLYFRKSNTLDDWTDGIPFGSNPIKHADSATNAEKLMGMSLVQLRAYINKQGE